MLNYLLFEPLKANLSKNFIELLVLGLQEQSNTDLLLFICQNKKNRRSVSPSCGESSQVVPQPRRLVSPSPFLP